MSETRKLFAAPALLCLAEQAGLQVGDRTVAVAGEPVAGWKATGLRITGTPGTVVQLTVERDGEARTHRGHERGANRHLGQPNGTDAGRASAPATTPAKPAGNTPR